MKSEPKLLQILHRVTRLFIASLLFITSLLLSACGSGSGGSGGGIGGSGIRDTDVSVGEVTGFGSVFISNNRFDTSAAEIFVNGRIATESELRIGMVVTAAVDFESARAARVEYLPLMVGPVSAVNAATSNFEIFGLQIRLSDSVIFEGLTLEELAPGLVLEVSGYFDLTGVIDATFIRATNAPDNYFLQGVAAESGSGYIFDPGGLNDLLGGLSTLLPDLDIEFEIPVVANQTVLLSIPDREQILRDALVVYAAPPLEFSIGRTVDFTGYVRTVSAESQFFIDRFRVITTDETTYKFKDGRLATREDFAINTRLTISGSMLEQNVTVLADEIVIVE